MSQALLAEASATARIRLPDGLDPLLTLRPLWQGPGDPLMRLGRGTVMRAVRTEAGPASLRLELLGRAQITARAWGSGTDSGAAARAAQAALGIVPGLLGLGDDPAALHPRHELVASLARRFAGLRMARSGGLYEVLVPTIIAQKVTGFEARRSYRELCLTFGQRAPGPLGLWLPPAPEQLAALPYFALHRLGVERRRAEILARVAIVADRLEEGFQHGPDEARRRLLSLAGVGPWTTGEAVRLALGDPDSLSVGDYNLPSLVSWALAGERRATDERMLELLEPYRGQRARVVLLLETAGLYPPRRGSRLAPRAIADR